MIKEYARLDLLQPISAKDGKEAHSLVVYRPTCRQLTDVFDTAETSVQRLERFSGACVRALNGSDEPLEFAFGELNAADGAEIGSVISAFAEDAQEHDPDTIGDGFAEPLIYTLNTPIRMSLKEDSEVVTQIMFEARKVRDISEYLDATGATKEFHAFMRAFGKPMGLKIPLMTDIVIDALDYLDYLVIRDKVMPRFVNARKRWKRAS